MLLYLQCTYRSMLIIRSYNGSARSETAGCRIESIDWTRRNSRARKDAARLSVPSAAATSAALCVYVKAVPIVHGTSAGRQNTVNAHRNERIVSFTISNDTMKGVRPDLLFGGPLRHRDVLFRPYQNLLERCHRKLNCMCDVVGECGRPSLLTRAEDTCQTVVGCVFREPGCFALANICECVRSVPARARPTGRRCQ